MCSDTFDTQYREGDSAPEYCEIMTVSVFRKVNRADLLTAASAADACEPPRVLARRLQATDDRVRTAALRRRVPW
ncbi:hypothetical protein MA20_42150 [Bradyrhizobium japonicum]|uniref:Uncharacterized protein n=1 Tax=Bradyrhizobium japonicum TaxID=375 RepID=A0A0A3XH90_BRAJP|nr:hypothetical protein MA20_42150 [Bradyrhizobium japonicum]